MKAPDPYQTRPSLLRRVKDRDEGGWLLFYQQYRPLVIWLCARRSLNEAGAVDLVIQAVMLHFAKSDWEYDRDRGRFRNLILKVAEFKIREIRREQRRQELGVPFDELHAPPVFDEDTEAFEDEREAQLGRALAALCEDPKIPAVQLGVLTRVLQGRPVDEIAATLELTPGNCHVIKHRMLQKLRQQMEAPE
ncbi:MAG: polymerase sigma factor RpoE [Verrucomicrobiota bacterium]